MRAAAILIPILMLLTGASAARASLDTARAEPNLEKRSKLALDNADAVLKTARHAYRTGDTKAASAEVKEVGDSVDLAYTALTSTGKNPRKSPRWFKHAEIKTRELLRALDDFQREMSFDDRAALDQVKAKVQQVHDELLTGLMEGKRK